MAQQGSNRRPVLGLWLLAAVATTAGDHRCGAKRAGERGCQPPAF
jgi:hypothetical protein